MRLSLLVALLLPLLATAEEIDSACDLARARANVTASEIGAPSAFASLGEPSIQQKTIAVGISQSVTGIMRARTVRAAGEADCNSTRSSVRLQEFFQWGSADVNKRGAIASLRIVDNAISLAEKDVSLLSAQLQAQTVSILDFTSAQHQLEALQKEKANLLVVISNIIPPFEKSDITSLVNDYISDQGNAAELSARAQAQSGWDFSLSAGVRKPFDAGTLIPNETSNFITASFKYSFGAPASMRASRQVGRSTKQLLASQQIGYSQILQRNRLEIASLIDTETINIQTATQVITALKKVREPLDNLNSALAQNAKRTLDIQLMSSEADLAGASTRLSAIRELFSSIGGL